MVGALELIHQWAELANADRSARGLNFYTAAPGSQHEARLLLLSSWAATPREATSAGHD